MSENDEFIQNIKKYINSFDKYTKQDFMMYVNGYIKLHNKQKYLKNIVDKLLSDINEYKDNAISYLDDDILNNYTIKKFEILLNDITNDEYKKDILIDIFGDT